MTKSIRSHMMTRRTLALLAIIGVSPMVSGAQDRLRTMPGYEQYQRMTPQLSTALRTGAVNGQWVEGGKALEYMADGKRFRFDLATRRVSDVPAAAQAQPGGGGRGRGGGGGGVARGRQVPQSISPDSGLVAFYRDRNLYVTDRASYVSPDRVTGREAPITTDGSEKDRIKYGTASWVYGEELGQTTAIWWSPDSKKIAYYRFDEKPVPDFYLQLNQTQLQSTVDVEAYPKAGVDNPIVDIFVYDIATKQTTKIDVRDGKPFENGVVGHYVYGVRWSPDGKELLFNRTNRRQNIMEFTACAPETGKCRVIIREEWPTGWVENSPGLRYLADNKRFIWESERTGFNNFYLYDLSGKLLATLTNHPFEVGAITAIDEKGGVLYYTARSGDNHLKMQFHRVGLDGKGDRRLTDPAFNHTVSLSPDFRFFTDVAQTHNTPPVTRLMDVDGKVVAELGKSDISRYAELKLRPAEMFDYTAADGKTKLKGIIHFPSNFDATKKYPVLMSVYGGPASGSNTPSENFAPPNATTEYGFIVVNLSSRAAPGMGKRTLDAIYLKLGQVEMDDMAEGIKALGTRAYVDKSRVGVYGTSYGGYTSAMLLLRHPTLFAAAASSSPVTDWRHYDTIYTERYMWIPQENKEGYDEGSAMKYVANLKGRLMLYYGTADNNVHPSNMMQLIQALQRAGKSFEVQVGPDAGHSGLNQQRMMEFFIENLIMRPSVATME
jgi:dipeptidyl-peptidase-4